jgi:small subunit ribosomal protein S1
MQGQTIPCKVIEVTRHRNRLILSQRAAMREHRRERLEQLEAGQVVTGQIVSLVKFGAFVDLGGIDGLVHVSEMAWHRVDDPEEVLSVGDEIEVYVKNVDRERERISLSLKELLPNPWDSVEEVYEVGQLVECTVTNVVDFGAFAELPSGLEGLIHASQMSSYGPSNTGDLLHKGDEVLARIASLDAERHRIGLSLDAVPVEEQAEWMRKRVEAENAQQSKVPDDEAGTAEEVRQIGTSSA